MNRLRLKPYPLQHANGFTLLEMVLSLALSLIILGMISYALNFFTIEVDRSDREIRRTMLAAALMQMIEDDLAGALHPEPLDTSALEELLSSTAGDAAALGGAAAGGDDTTDTDDASAPPDDTADDSDTLTDDTLETGDTLGTLVEPGLIGNQFQLQFDTSRLPRLEEYTNMIDDETFSTVVDVPSDMKTVTYYVQQSGAMAVQDKAAKLDNQSGSGANQGGGLVRRSIDRAATQFSMNNGNLTTLMQTGDVLAPEVVAIEFSYWDGLLWQIEWDSDLNGSLPLAIKVTMQMIDPLDEDSQQTPRVFEHIVRLPMGEMAEEEEEEMLDGSTSSDSSSEAVQ